MSKPYSLPTARVLSAVLFDNVATVVIKISRETYLNFPIGQLACDYPIKGFRTSLSIS